MKINKKSKPHEELLKTVNSLNSYGVPQVMIDDIFNQINMVLKKERELCTCKSLNYGYCHAVCYDCGKIKKI